MPNHLRLEAVEMVRYLLGAVVSIGLPSTASFGADIEFQYDTKHRCGPHALDPGSPTPLQIRLVNNSGTAWAVGWVAFDFQQTSGSATLTWDDGFDWEPLP